MSCECFLCIATRWRGVQPNNNLLAHPINLKITFVRQKCSKKSEL